MEDVGWGVHDLSRKYVQHCADISSNLSLFDLSIHSLNCLPQRERERCSREKQIASLRLKHDSLSTECCAAQMCMGRKAIPSSNIVKHDKNENFGKMDVV